VNAESQSLPLKKSWISAHPFVVIGVTLVVCLGPFLNQAIQTDDALFVWTAEWIQKHPADFFGFKVNWWVSAIPMWVANYNPPLMSYFLAGVASLFGWNEIVLHLACLAVAFTAAAGIYALANTWCECPLLATVVAIFTPAFLVSSTTLMCDVLMLSFWIWALVFWERALGSEQSRWQYVGAGMLAGLAVLAKYSAVTLLPLLPVLSILRTRKLGWWWLGLVVPLMMVAGYECLTAKMYGHGLLSAAGHYAQSHQFGFSGGWKAKGIIGLAFAGGSLLPMLFFAPWLWRWRILLTSAILIFGMLLGGFWLYGDLGLIHPWLNPEALKDREFQLQVMLLTAGGLHLLLLVGTEIWQRRDAVSITLALWITSVFVFATVLNWTVNARSFLPAVPAVVILLVRRLKATRENLVSLDWLPLVPAAAITLSLVVANHQLAGSARTAAKRIAAKYKTTDHKLWLNGHGGFQYYMEKLGAQPVDLERSLLLPGDIVVVSWLSGDNVTLPPGSVGAVENIMHELDSWMNLQGGGAHGAAGFYSSDWGPIPFALRGHSLQEYFIVKVFSRVQYKSQPANPWDAQAGAAPSFSRLDYSMDDRISFAENPVATEQIRLACQFEKEGKIEEAVRHYHEALMIDSNAPVALNNLALILATTSKPGLRDGKEAVRFATRAVELTELRQPGVIGTLAAAYAEDGQFAKAVALAQIARSLAMVTGQLDLAASNLRLLNRYAAGKATGASGGP
jgi:hypothetical protein